MRRLAVTSLILVAAALMAAASLGAVPHVARSKATVRVKSCSLVEKTAVFYGRMRKRRGTRRMRMRFGLLERAAGSHHFKRVHAPALAHWRKSAEGVRAYGYSQEVRGLNDGSTYRMRVRYRWYDKNNKLQRRARRTSRACRMFVPLPNLRLRLVDTLPLGGGVWRYRVRVSNSGQLGAGEVAVRLSVDGEAQGTKTIPALEPGESLRLAFNGSACKTRYAFNVDPDGTVPESNESDNRVFSGC